MPGPPVQWHHHYMNHCLFCSQIHKKAGEGRGGGGGGGALLMASLVLRPLGTVWSTSLHGLCMHQR